MEAQHVAEAQAKDKAAQEGVSTSNISIQAANSSPQLPQRPKPNIAPSSKLKPQPKKPQLMQRRQNIRKLLNKRS